jgi:hypothetical protein
MPANVLRSAQFASLSARSVKLLMDLLSQFRGNNNGDLCATWTLMQRRGWRSRDTLAKAIRELQIGGWIAMTRQGGMHAPTLYGVTFFALDPSPKLEVSVADFPRGKWYRMQTLVRPATKRGRQHANRVNAAPINTPTVPITASESIN